MWILVRWSIGCFHKLYLLGGSFVKFQIPSYILNLFFKVFFFFFLSKCYFCMFIVTVMKNGMQKII